MGLRALHLMFALAIQSDCPVSATVKFLNCKTGAEKPAGGPENAMNHMEVQDKMLNAMSQIYC